MRVRCKYPGLAVAVTALAVVAGPSGADDFMARDRIVEGLVPVTGAASERRKLDLRIQFALGSAELDTSSLRQLDALAKALKSPELHNARIAIHGHTDASGSAELNLALSRARAQSVRDYLVDQRGVAVERLKVRGFGERRLLAPSRPKAAINRRVTVVNLNTRAGAAPDAGSDAANDGGTTAITGD